MTSDPNLDTLLDRLDLDEAVASFERVLADGPLRDDALLAALRADGAWGEIGDLPDEQFAAAIDELDVTGLWRTQMAHWFDIDRMLDGRVFTHRVTAAELAAGAVAALPDFTLVDFDLPERHLTDGSGPLRADYAIDVAGFDGGALVGPDGWLASFAAGDVIGLRIAGPDGVSVERLGADALPASDAEAVGALAAAFRPCFDRWANGVGDELGPATLDVLVDIPDAFVTPTLPLQELAAAAGLERRGLQFGPADRPWMTVLQAAVARQAGDVAAESPDWLADPFRRLSAVYVEWLGDPAAPLPATSIDTARAALAEEGAAGLLAEVVRGRTATGAGAGRSLAEFVAAIGGADDSPAGVGAHHLLGVAATLERRYADAEAEFGAVVAHDPGQLDALVELGIAASDRGDALEADRRFRAAGGPDPWLAALAGLLPPRSTGRNDPCPCGSGRKFKQCCLITPKAPVERRGDWYALRVARHLANHELSAVEHFYDLLSEELPAEVTEIDHASIEDLVAYAVDATGDYLDAHAATLDDVDRAGLASWRDAAPTLWRAERTPDGLRLTPRGAESAGSVADAAPAVVLADATDVAVHPASGLTVARIVPLGTSWYVASSVAVDDLAADEFEGLIADDDAVSSVVEWGLWYASTFEI